MLLGGALMIRNTREITSLSILCGHRKKAAVCKPERGSSPNIESAGALILDFLAPKTMINKCLLSKPHTLWYCEIIENVYIGLCPWFLAQRS